MVRTMAQALAEADEKQLMFYSPEKAMERINIASGEDAYSDDAWAWHEHEGTMVGELQ